MNQTATGKGMAIRIPVELNKAVKAVAVKERRSQIDQMAIFIEAGLAEYERQMKLLELVRSGGTDIDAEFLARNGGMK